jgi:hypothetical protein
VDAYFGPRKRTPVEGRSPEEFTFENESHREAGHPEVYHLGYIADYDWGRYWHGDLGKALKEPSMNTIFFHCFAVQLCKTTTVLTYALTCLPFDYDLSSSPQKQPVVAFQSYHGM